MFKSTKTLIGLVLVSLLPLAGCQLSAMPTGAAFSMGALETPQFNVQGAMDLLFHYKSDLHPIEQTGDPAVDAQGRLYVPMRAVYTGSVTGPDFKTVYGNDSMKVYITPEGRMLGGEFNIVDVLTDHRDGKQAVAQATGSGVVQPNGTVPFTLDFKFVAEANGVKTDAKFSHMIGRKYQADGMVNSELTQFRQTVYR